MTNNVVSYAVATAVDEFVDRAHRGAERFENITLLGESQVFDLHALAARIYGMGYDDGLMIEHTRSAAAAHRRASNPAIDVDHINRQRRFSEATFGPGDRLAGILQHLAKELQEVQQNPGDLSEWADLIILAIDGAWRQGATAAEIIVAVKEKQGINEQRTWPNWRTAAPDAAIEHDRTAESGES